MKKNGSDKKCYLDRSTGLRGYENIEDASRRPTRDLHPDMPIPTSTPLFYEALCELDAAPAGANYQLRRCPFHPSLLFFFFSLPMPMFNPGKVSPSRSGSANHTLRRDPGSAFHAPPGSGRRQGTPPRRFYLGGRAQCGESDTRVQVQRAPALKNFGSVVRN